MSSTKGDAEPPAPMTEGQKRLVAEEDAMRQLFAEQPQHERLTDAHLLLHKVYEGGGEVTAKYSYTAEDSEEARVPKLLTYARDLTRIGTPAIVPKAGFDARLQEFTQGCFNGLDWTHVFMAGGAVLGALQNNGDDGYKSSDIDLFVHGVASEAEASAVLKHVYDVVLRNTRGRGDVVRSHRALTILCAYPYRHVQVVLRLYKSPAEVLLGFDIDACCVGYDGTDVWAMERFQRALTKRYNLVNVSRRSLTYEQRLAKYAKRGFAVAVPNLDKARVNATLFTKRPHELMGLSKLLLYDYLHHAIASNGGGGAAARGVAKARAQAASDEDTGSDYNGDVTLPWGPQWQNEAIINLVHAQHKAHFFSQLRRQTGTKGAAVTAAPTGAAAGAGSKGFEHVLTADASELKASDFSAWQRSLDKKKVTQPLTWIKDSPAYQDYDNGFRRLMTGSFEPVVDANWERDAYAATDAQKADPRLLSKNTDTKNTAPQQGLGFAAQAYPRAKPTAQPTKSFGANNVALKKQKKFKKSPAAAKQYTPKDESDEDEDEEEEEEERPKKKAAKKVAAKKMPQPTSAVTPQKHSFGGSGFGAPQAATGFGAAQPTQPTGFGFGAAVTPVSKTAGGSVSLVPQTLSSFGGPSLAPPGATGFGLSPPPAATAAPSAYTLSNFGGYGGPAVPFTNPSASAFIDTPSKGLAALGPQPGASFGFTTATPAPISAVPLPQAFGGPSIAPPYASHPPTQPSGFAPPPYAAHPVSQPSGLAPPPYASQPSLSSASSAPAFSSSTARALLLIALFAKQGRLTAADKGALKERALRQDALLTAALEVFEIDQDLEELLDTLRRIAAL